MPARIDHQYYEGTELKRCCVCKVFKELQCFSASKREWDNLSRTCRACTAERGRRWLASNHEKHRRRVAKWRGKNSEKAKQLGKKYQKLRRLRSPGHAKSQDKKYRQVPRRRISHAISNGIRAGLMSHATGKSSKNGNRWEVLVGYTLDDLLYHLEMQFEPEFTFENYGVVWEIDHIVPISAHKFESHMDDGFKKCWSLNNLRPLSVTQNRQKGVAVLPPLQSIIQTGRQQP